MEEVRPVKLEQNAQKIYDGIEKDSFAELMNGEITTCNVLTQLLRLSQITGGFVRNDDGDDTQQLSTAKLDALEDVIDSCMEEGKKSSCSPASCQRSMRSPVCSARRTSGTP